MGSKVKCLVEMKACQFNNQKVDRAVEVRALYSTGNMEDLQGRSTFL